MRITNLTTQARIAQDLSKAQSEYADKQLQISSGRNYTRRSEEPSAAAEAGRLEQENERSVQWAENAGHGLSTSQITGARIDEIVDRMHRANELVVRANDGSLSTEDRRNLALEVDSILEDMAITANAKFNDSYLFAGTRSDQPAYEITRTDGRITAVNYNGNDDRKRVQIGDQTMVETSVLGSGSNGLFEDNSQGVDVFDHLIQFRDELNADQPPSDTTAAGLANDLDSAISHLVSNGVQQSRLRSLTEHYADKEQVINHRIGEIENLDVAQAITQLSQMEASFQASLQMAARINQLSIINFI